ncbi:hypothetical protein P5673_016782 [Acropora cervicornis]|uniref:Uncharacterized protein n=1 Tax=Acropora cervicornis TaxID=6130 RepID=A0AAD9QFR0_ACRCE|nr:hypothetical protein P5673_016782 [Acropora cervicornis]
MFKLFDFFTSCKRHKQVRTPQCYPYNHSSGNLVCWFSYWCRCLLQLC